MLKSIRQKLFIYFLIFISIVTLAAGFISTVELQKFFHAKMSRQMRTQIDLIEFILANPPQGDSIYHTLTDYARISKYRLTLIDSAGVVIFDSKVPRDSLIFVENHGNRPEIREAARTGIGSDERLSHTINTGLFYMATKIPAGKSAVFNGVRFIRLSIPLREIDEMMAAVQGKIIAGGLIAFLIVALLSYYFARRLTHPLIKLTHIAEQIKRGAIDTGFSYSTNDEIGQLSKVLDEMLQKLRQDVVEMDRLQKVRSRFLGNVSHELRTPIFTLQGYLETLLSSPEADEQLKQKFLAKAFKQSERLNMLLTDLIDISRIESGEMKMSFRYFELGEWLNACIPEFENKAQANHISLKLSLDSATKNVQILGDRQRLNQVMINLVSNAIKYNNPNGQVEIRSAIDQNKIIISIRDTGPGIAAKHLPRLFERFYRVDTQRSRDIGGTGLGLAIVKHIVDAHGGEIKVESEPGEGSTFSIILDMKSEKTPAG